MDLQSYNETYVRNGRLLTYDIKVSPKISSRSNWLKYKDKTCLNVVISNILACVRKGNRLVYSRRVGGKQPKSRKGITVRRVIRAMDYLEREGLIVNFIGTGHRSPELRSISWVLPTPALLDFWSDEELYQESEVNHLESIEAIELRGKDKKPIEYKHTEDTRIMEKTVRALNTLNENSNIKDKDGKILTNIYCRIFNESFKYGGRFYRADILSIKNRGTEDRLKITINDQPVCELDYSNLHFRIAAALEGIFPEDLPLDVYSDLLEDESNKVDRNIIKVAVNIMFNTNNRGSAERAVRGLINNLSESDKEKYTLGSAKSVLSLVEARYPEFVHLFYDENMFGMALQNEDSHLANDIINVMVENNIPCLPVHDSFIVPLDNLDLLLDTMGDKFRERFDWDGTVPVGVKFFDNGELVDYRIEA